MIYLLVKLKYKKNENTVNDEKRDEYFKKTTKREKRARKPNVIKKNSEVS